MKRGSKEFIDSIVDIIAERYATAKAQASCEATPVSAPSESQEAKIILEKFRQFITDQKDIDPEISKVIQAKLWEII